MSKTNAAAVIKVLRTTFARFGLPTELVSDQGPPFTSTEFKDFLTNSGIKQNFSAAYHPSSNGAAENAVKHCKKVITKSIREGVDVDAALQTFLLAYRNSVHSSTGESPAMLLQKRSLRSRLDLLRSEWALVDKVQQAQYKQVDNAGGVPRSFGAGEPVWARDYGARDKWLKGTVVQAEGSRRYVLSREDGRQLIRHVDQVRRRSGLFDAPIPGDGSGAEESGTGREGDAGPHSTEATNTGAECGIDELGKGELDAFQSPSKFSTPYSSPQEPPLEPSRVKRIRKPVVRFKID